MQKKLLCMVREMQRHRKSNKLTPKWNRADETANPAKNSNHSHWSRACSIFVKHHRISCKNVNFKLITSNFATTRANNFSNRWKCLNLPRVRWHTSDDDDDDCCTSLDWSGIASTTWIQTILKIKISMTMNVYYNTSTKIQN